MLLFQVCADLKSFYFKINLSPNLYLFSELVTYVYLTGIIVI